MAKTRTFIAVAAPPEVRQRASDLVKRVRPLVNDFRWVTPHGMHYTLQFLGDLSDQDVADACTRIGLIAADWEPFKLEARGVGAFPDLARPRTLWIGAGQGASELTALQHAIESELEGLGFRAENRRYVPHLTVGKSGRSGSASPGLSQQLKSMDDFDAGVMAVDEVTVFASELLKEGPEYHVLATCPLLG